MASTAIDRALEHEILTSAQEVELGQLMDTGKLAAEEMEAGGKLTPAQKRRLTATVAEGKAARDHFINSNLRLVRKVISSLSWARDDSFSKDEAFSIGVMGLIRAVDGFDWKKGFKFSTYATWWIRKELTQGLAVIDSSPGRRSTGIREKSGILSEVEEMLIADLRRVPTNAEIAKVSAIPERQVELWRSKAPSSIEQVVMAAGDTAMMSSATAGVDIEILEAIAEQEMVSAVHRTLDLIENDRDRAVIKARFGIGREAPASIAEIAAEMEISVTSVNDAMRRARAFLDAHRDDFAVAVRILDGPGEGEGTF